jgi:hypothetical protein
VTSYIVIIKAEYAIEANTSREAIEEAFKNSAHPDKLTAQADLDD